MSPERITIQLDDKRRRLGAWWQKVQHVIGGVPLLLAGVDRFPLATGVGRVLAVAEIVVAAVLLALFARDVRSAARTPVQAAKSLGPPDHAHAGPEWFDVAAGALLILEAVLATHPGGKPLYQHAVLYLGAVTLFTGLAHGALSRLAWRRRFVRIDGEGIRARLSPLRNFNISWADVIDIRLGERSAIVVTKGGSHAIRLSRYENAIEIRNALADWRERKERILERR